jgi:hypothetical protein
MLAALKMETLGVEISSDSDPFLLDPMLDIGNESPCTFNYASCYSVCSVARVLGNI